MFAFIVQSIDKLLLITGYFYISWKQPTKEGDSGSLAVGDCGGNEEKPAFEPVVLVQIPMRNERECYKRGIMAACRLDWPQDKLVVQVLDDSDDPDMQQLVRDEVDAWRAVGAPIRYTHRTARTGFKAGALAHGMQDPAIQHCEYVAIFDADFVPAKDFLRRTVPKFEGQPKLALVQARWAFANAQQNLLTRFQVISMSYHFEVEQQVQNHFNAFFGFNGTAGVWRVQALREAGGWLARTTTEDMDLAVRAHMKGWNFTYLNDVTVPSELPCTYKAYCKQQQRWHAGPARLFMLTWHRSLTCPTLSAYQKFNLLVCFFWFRRFVLPVTGFLLYCIIMPLAVLLPEASLPLWFLAYMQTQAILHWLPHRGSWCLLFPYYAFENVMYRVKAQAIFSGLFNLRSAHVWVVTAKTGIDAKTENIQSGGSKCVGKEGGVANDAEPVSPVSEGSSDDAFVAHASMDPLIAYDLPELRVGLKVRTAHGRGEETSGHCTGLDSSAKRRDFGHVSSPMKRGLWSPSAGRRLSLLTPTEERAERDPSLLTSFEAGAAWRLERTLYRLPSLREVWEKVTWANVRGFMAVRTLHVPELGWAAFVFGAMTYGISAGRYGLSVYLGMQGLGYLIAGLDLMGY
ncbi:Glycosyl transferase family 2 protein [Klebsormidium nitens]|uniref:glucomannan 4-beta-mannosyltransferase n=1 Tax=Klebsormidium nitens TaxID=105231 RepID=A0A1Y1HW38_KLENI|nr:Glycosyl transferase family 2 protein [Klebsormidium nitens]|eukprot:GAQ82845.1 Glycosyl transferase family 2 protein [Klebsormidium nitens]